MTVETLLSWLPPRSAIYHSARPGADAHAEATRLVRRISRGRGRDGASGFQILTPHYGGLLWYDSRRRWVKGSLEIRGEGIDYVFDV